MFVCGSKSAPKPDPNHFTQAQVLEEQILKLSGLELSTELTVRDVPIDFQGQNYIHTYECGDGNNHNLVLLHGFGGCSALYYGMLKELSQKYHVFCIDLLGMGLSSRPEFKCESTQETIDYFVESLEKWREAMNLTEFSLGGHSFGGYMASQYALKYQSRVKKLFLLSPAGITKHEKPLSIEEFIKKLSWVRRQVFGMVLKFWESKTTPGEYYRKHSMIGSYLLRKYMERQFGNNGKEKELADLLYKFFSELFKLEGGSDQALYFILKPPRAIAILPLEEHIAQDLQIPVVCYYGDKDWMDTIGANRIATIRGKDFKLKEIQNSGHQVTMHNPKELARDLVLEIVS